MPKHGWKWRTQRFRQMSEGELRKSIDPPRTQFISQGRVMILWEEAIISPRMARWIYKNLIPNEEREDWLSESLVLLDIIARGESPYYRFFGDEIERTKQDFYGMHVVEKMSGRIGDIKDAQTLINLYEDDAACPEVRGEALFALAYLQKHTEPAWLTVTEEVCLDALHNVSLPYARAGACFLAAWSYRFRGEVEALCHDETIAIQGWGQTVSFYARDAYEHFDTM